MAFDFKKKYKEFYMPKNIPEIYLSDERNVVLEKFSSESFGEM